MGIENAATRAMRRGEDQLNNLQRITMVFSQFKGVYHEAAKAFHVADSQLSLLYSLRLFDGSLPQKELVAVSELPKQTAGSAIRKMEQEGLVVSQPMDGKQRRITLTAAGEQLAERTVDRLVSMEAGLLEQWGPRKSAQYISLGQEYLDALRDAVRRICDEEGDTR